MKVFKIVIALLFLILAGLYSLSSRYEIQVLGKSRDACLRLDKWTGKIELQSIQAYTKFGLRNNKTVKNNNNRCAKKI